MSEEETCFLLKKIIIVHLSVDLCVCVCVCVCDEKREERGGRRGVDLVFPPGFVSSLCFIYFIL